MTSTDGGQRLFYNLAIGSGELNITNNTMLKLVWQIKEAIWNSSVLLIVLNKIETDTTDLFLGYQIFKLGFT